MAAKKKAVEAPTAYTLEALLVGGAGFGLTTATPVQRAICRAAEGRPLGDLATDPAVVLALGGPEAIERLCGRPLELVLLSGIRAGKSLIVAALAVYASQTVDLSLLGAGEVARVSVLSLSLDTAKVVYNHITGNVLAKPALRALLAEEPTSDTVVLRHPSGRLVEIKIVAGAKAGGTLVARWSAGVIFDEAPRMSGDEAVVNFPDARASALGRLLPGAQLVALGSPWAPAGPVYDTVTERWGKPGADLLVIKAPAYAMNPVWWTEARVAEFRARNPDLARTEIDAEFADPEAALLSSVDLDACTRQAPAELPPDPRCAYVATIDPAARGNAWTLVLGTREGGRVRVVLVRQWIGSKVAPLSPAAVLVEMAALLRPYRCDRVLTDQWASDALRDLGRPLGLHLVERAWTAGNKFEAFESMRVRVALRGFDLPPDPVLRADLLAVRKRVTTTGVTVVLPETSDGRHADYAPALAMLARDWILEPGEFSPAAPLDSDEQAVIDEETDEESRLDWMLRILRLT